MTAAATEPLYELGADTDIDSRCRGLREIYDFSVRVTCYRLAKLLAHAEGARLARTTEPCHQMRVSARRTLAALALCAGCTGKDRFYDIECEVKAVIDALGDACDLDMILETLGQRARALPPGRRSCIEAFLQPLKQQRQDIEPEIGRAVTRLETRDLIAAFEEAAVPGPEITVAARHKCKRWDPACSYSDPDFALRITPGRDRESSTIEDDRSVCGNRGRVPPALFAHAARTIDARLRSMLNCEQHLFYPDRVVELHRMRLALKRLRYTMEIFEEIYTGGSRYGDEFRAAIVEMEMLQNRLGQIHDADVLIPRLTLFLADRLDEGPRHARHGEQGAGAHQVDFDSCLVLLQICQEIRERRDIHYRRFLDEWQRLSGRRYFDRLREMILAAADQKGRDTWR